MSKLPNFGSFVTELRRRRVFRVAAVYGAIAFVIAQVADIAFPALRLPEWALTLVVVLLLIGFPIALILAWAFDLTPEGLVRTEVGEEAQASAATQPGQARWGARRIAAVGGIVMLVVAGGAFILFGGSFERADAPELPRSVAVLPFENLSSDPENAYFSDGITEEILTNLSKIGALRVISRTSVMKYKKTEKGLPEIARELGVNHILEGSVQRVGDRVRINAQLINADTDEHLWAERYDRQISDIFAVQSEIAEQIANALRLRLSPAERGRIAAGRTENQEAYTLYLKGREYRRANALGTQENRQNKRSAITLLRRAIQLDPSFAAAYAELALAYQTVTSYEPSITEDSAIAVAKRAVLLAPDLGDGYAALGGIYAASGRWGEALAELNRAIELDPNGVMSVASIASVHASRGELDEGLRWAKRRVALEPTEGDGYDMVANIYALLGFDRQAEEWYRKRGEVEPGTPRVHRALVLLYTIRGEDARAAAHLDTLRAIAPNDLLTVEVEAAFARYRGDFATAARSYERMLAEYPGTRGGMADEVAHVYLRLAEPVKAASLLAEAENEATRWLSDGDAGYMPHWNLLKVHALRGNKTEALRSMQKVIEVDKGNRYRFLVTEPALAELRREPEFRALLAPMKAKVDRMRARVEREGL